MLMLNKRVIILYLQFIKFLQQLLRQSPLQINRIYQLRKHSFIIIQIRYIIIISLKRFFIIERLLTL